MEFEALFDEYANRYDTVNRNIKLKYEHSYRVADISYKLSKELNWSSEDVNLAFFIGLYHDIGRFEQIKRYNTFDDHKSLDHGAYGVKVLMDEGILTKIGFNEEELAIIKYSICNHNNYLLKQTNDERTMKHAMLVRDADKIDILKVFSLYKSLDTKKAMSPSEILKVQDCYNKHILLRDDDFINGCDSFLKYMSFVFDLNYKESYELFQKYLEELYHVINLEYKYEPYYNRVLSYIKSESNY